MSVWDDDDENDELDDGDGEGPWELDPTDPDHPDFDLSEASPYSGYQQRRGFLPPPQWLILLVSIIVLFALVAPLCARILL
jgi:hypothetical protein